ncbi:endonuclease [Maribacter sp. 2-571]|uniref:endonuclease n=1 Tax=Maribacter sp. 2-571 TaxID=3417569 RepID=UPI003D35790F
MKRNYIGRSAIAFFILIYGIFQGHAQVPSYYAGTDIAATGAVLKSNLATLVTDSQTTVLTYTPGVWDALKQTDLNPGDPSKVFLIYGYNDTDTDGTNDRTRSKDMNGGNVGDWNREHSYPKSLGNPNLGETGPGSDAHHLRASDVQFNGVRSNLRYTDADGNARPINGGFYPGDEWKGDVARMMFYMYLRYGDRCLPNAVGIGGNSYAADIPDIFLEWNAEDPVSQVELNRNVILEGIQGNRNPFIDNPAFATSIWGGPQAEDRFTGVDAQIVINEVDADQSGTDASEFIELYDGGFGNTALDGLVIVLYNGNSDESYASIDLDGFTTDANGYFVIGSANVRNVTLEAFTTNGIQNGADAVALYQDDAASFPTGTAITTTNLLDALVYGTGDADDLELLPLLNTGQKQIDENSDGNAADNSMQRLPNGQGGTRNTDTYGVLVPTPGTMNMEEVTVDMEAPSAPLNLSVTGVTSNTATIGWDASTDNIGVAEYQLFTENTLLANTSATSFQLIGLLPNTAYEIRIVAVDAAGNSSEASDILSFTTLDSVPSTGNAIVISGVFDGPLSGGVPKGVELYVTEDIADLSVYGLGSANNGNGTNGVEFSFPAEAAAAGSFLYVASETTGFTSFFGFAPDYVSGAMAINGDDAIELFKDGNVIDVFGEIAVDGSGAPWEYADGWAYRTANTGPDGATFALGNWTFSGPNALDNETVNATATNAFPIGSFTTGPAQIVINEIDADNPGTDASEFIELYDGGTGNTALDGLVVVLYNGSDDQSYNNAIDLDGFTTDANGYFVIGSALVPNVDLVAFTTNGLQNGADAVALYQGDASSFPNDTPLLINDSLIDALVYDTSDGDDAVLLTLLNPGEEQINEDAFGDKDGQSLQRLPNGTGGLRNTGAYEPALPTPGTENGAVPPAPDTISILEARNTAEGELVTVSGILTVSDQFAGSAYLQDDTAGIAIFDETVHGEGNFMIGDSITVTGTRSAFNEQVQLSSVTEVVNNGVPDQQILPRTIAFNELGDYPGQLVRIANPDFPRPGDILFGNSNYELSDTSGIGEIRIDNDVAAIVGLGQPDTCSEVIGVVGRFFETYQLLPRSDSDLSCAEPYVPPGSTIAIDQAETFDVVTWNIEWFGEESNSPAAGNPMSDAIQRDSVRTILESLNADVIAVQEIVDVPLFEELIGTLPNYSYVLSPATSRPDATDGMQQKVGFIYNTNTVSVVDTRPLLESIHPLYNGGDDTALADYPVSDKTRFYASGRLPFLITADVTIGGSSKRYDIVGLHARANSGSSPQERYDMRKFDVEVLKDSLDTQFADTNLILLGDFNDDVDETVADVDTTVSSYEVYTADTENFTVLSAALSEAGFRSFAFRENMIDHIAVSNEVVPTYIDETVSVGYAFYDNDYTNTVSDHFPVSARFVTEVIRLETLVTDNVSCNGGNDGAATAIVNGGVGPYTYLWSDGQTDAMASGLMAGEYSLTVTDALGATLEGTVLITEPEPIGLSVSEDIKLYLGYHPSGCKTIDITAMEGGLAPFTYAWSTGETTANIRVCPEETTDYTITVTDANGCTAEATVNIEVVDVRCGNGDYDKVEVCFRGRTFCVSQIAAWFYLYYGGTLGSCDGVAENTVTLETYPNPFTAYVIADLTVTKKSKVRFLVYNRYGRLIKRERAIIEAGNSKIELHFGYLRPGPYYLQTIINGSWYATEQLIKQ